MAEKGDKARLYDVAFSMFTRDRKSLTEIEAILGVSRQTLGQWKADSKRPSDEFDAWDQARAQKQTNAQRLRDLFERELSEIEKSKAGSVTTASLDAITKLGTLVQRWEASESGLSFDRPKVFLENLQWIAGWLRENDPEGLKILAKCFDALTMDFKLESLNGHA